MAVRVCFVIIQLLAVSIAQEQKPKNVLFMPVDDLRPELFEAYNQKYMHTPNLDKLAKESLVFQRAYCQHALCIPSRNSFMTGRRPDTTKVWAGLGNPHFRVTGPDWISLPEHFKNHGFTTLGGGKTYHPNKPPDWDEPKSWSQDQPYFPFKLTDCPNSTITHQGENKVEGTVAKIDTWCPLDEKSYNDSWHYDWKLANQTIHTLKYVNSKKEPWFVAAGFRRPHDPWMMPQRFWDMYSSSDIPTVLHRSRPVDSPDIAFHNQGLFLYSNGSQYLPMPNPIPVEIQQEARHGYMASVSWVDSQIGRVLDTLDEMNLKDNTLVVIFGDHGYQLGEHDSWHKMTNWELATRVPLIIRAPWLPKSMGKVSYALVELVDLYRTIADLVGAPEPGKDIEGTSFSNLFAYPELDAYEAAKMLNKTAAAFSQYTRCINNKTAQWDDNECPYKPNSTVPALMGYSMRTPEWRYTAWMHWDVLARKALWEKESYAVELYDHSGDPDIENDFNNQCEMTNVAKNNEELVKELQQKLEDFFS